MMMVSSICNLLISVKIGLLTIQNQLFGSHLYELVGTGMLDEDGVRDL